MIVYQKGYIKKSKILVFFLGNYRRVALNGSYQTSGTLSIMKNKTHGFTLVEIMIVVVIIGLLASMAIPAVNKVRTNAREKVILNNLRQFVAAAQQYFLDSGNATVEYTSIVGTQTTKYIRTLQPIASEVYTGLTLADTDTQITITYGGGTEGTTLTYTF